MVEAKASDFAGKKVEVEIDGHCFVLSDSEAEGLADDIQDVIYE